jgi:Carboxypeptidase regulatory-like domain
MKRAGTIFGTALAAIFLVLSPAQGDETVCKVQGVKKVSHVCGSILNPLGVPVPGAKVMIFKDGADIGEVQSDESGKFSFDSLKEGNYEIQVLASGYASFAFSVVLANTDKKCKRALQIALSIRASACTGNVRLAKP